LRKLARLGKALSFELAENLPFNWTRFAERDQPTPHRPMVRNAAWSA